MKKSLASRSQILPHTTDYVDLSEKIQQQRNPGQNNLRK